MKTEEEIKEELSKVGVDGVENSNFFVGWKKALEWVLQ